VTDDVAVDVLITNHNYGCFVGQAVDSACRQTYPAVRVVVVDDGSTDDSRERLRAHEGDVDLVFKGNRGQASAINAGVDRCAGDVVMLLDGDDVLLPHAAANVAAAFAADPDVVKVQFPLDVIDAEGRPTGLRKPPPHLPLPSGDVRTAELAFPFDLPWLPTSSNAFRADALRRILPIPEEEYPVCADSYLVHLTALLGAVVSLSEAGGCYRVHGRNNHEPQAPRLDLPHLREGMQYSRTTTDALAHLADELGLERPDRILSVSHLAQRLISRKLEPEHHPLPEDDINHILGDAIQAASRRFDISFPMKAGFVMWFMLTAFAPRRVAQSLAELFLFPNNRIDLLRLGRHHRGTYQP
jgi:Glycosyl transferase family 2